MLIKFYVGVTKMSSTPLYITSSGILKREHNTIAIRGDGRPVYKPVERVLSVYVYGNYTINTSLLGFLDDLYVPIHIFNRAGFYRGSFYNPPIPSSEVFVKQIEWFSQKENLTRFMAIVKEAYRQNLSFFSNDISSYQNLDNVHTLVLSAFKGLLYASLVDGVYMTHLDPTAMPGIKGRGMPLVYTIYQVFVPSVYAIYDKFIDSCPPKNSYFYQCKDTMCFRREYLIKLLSFWEHISSESIKLPYGTYPRRHLFKREFYKLEKWIVFGKEYVPFVGLWGE